MSEHKMGIVIPPPGRAVNISEKREIIERLFKLWVDNADLRLGQLIANVFPDPYNAEDFAIVEELEAAYNMVLPKRFACNHQAPNSCSECDPMG